MIVIIVDTSTILSFCHGFRAVLAVDKCVYYNCLSALVNTEC